MTYTIVIVLILGAALLAGCTAIGFTLGAVRDANTLPWEAVPCSEWEQLGPGQEIEIVTIKDDTMQGEYVSVERLPRERADEECRLWYDDSTQNTFLPSIGDTINIFMEDSFGKRERIDCGFYGVDASSVRIKMLGRDAYISIPIRGILELRDRRGGISGVDILNKIDGRVIPIPMFLNFQSTQKTHAVHYREIKNISIENSRNAKWYGALIGFPLDVLGYLTFRAFEGVLGVGVD